MCMDNNEVDEQCTAYNPFAKSMPLQMGLARAVRAVSCNVMINMTSCGVSGARRGGTVHVTHAV